MKTIFISGFSKSKIDKKRFSEISKNLPKHLLIAYSIQFKGLADKLEKALSQNHHILNKIQVLGCSSPKIPKQTQAILLIGSGKFHAISLFIKSKKPVYVFEGNKIIEISKKEIEDFEKNKKASYINFLNSNKIGVLISIKPGQERFERALQLKNKIKNKSLYFFISKDIDIREFENFGLKSYINSACPRMDLNSTKLINISEIELF